MVPAKLTNTSFCLHSFIQDLFFHKKHWFKTLSLAMKIQLEHVIVLNLKYIKSLCQPFSVCYWQKVKEGGLVLQGKLYCYSTPTLHTHEKCFLFLFPFFLFSFFGVLRLLPQICRLWLIWLLWSLLWKKRRFRSFLIKWYINRYYILFSYALNKNTSSCLN